MSTFLHRIFTSFLSILVFSALLAGFQTFIMNSELSFGLLLSIYIFYSIPVFLIGGVTASYIVDQFLRSNTKVFISKLRKYVHSLAFYGLAGIVVAMIYSSITSISHGEYLFTFNQSFTTIMMGILAATVFYNIYVLLDMNWEKMIRAYKEEIEKAEHYY